MSLVRSQVGEQNWVVSIIGLMLHTVNVKDLGSSPKWPSKKKTFFELKLLSKLAICNATSSSVKAVVAGSSPAACILVKSV